jgi:hypothetical protein
MEDYGVLPFNQLIDLLSDNTAWYNKLYSEKSKDKEITDLKIKIIALQEEIKKRKEFSDNKNQ